MAKPRKRRGKQWEKKKAALYTRVSTAYQVDKDSLPLQRKKLKEYCDFNDLEYEMFEDAGLSAKSDKRPAYQEMMERVRNGEFSHVVVYKLDRISRNLINFMEMYEELEGLKVSFISLNENFSTDTAMGKAMLAIMMVFAQMEREIDSERVLAVMIGRAENDRTEVNSGKGLWNGAQTPMGFRFDTETMYPVPDEKEMEVVHLIFDKYEEMGSTTKVCRYLNQNSIPSKRGGKWTSKVVGDIIQNKFYIGVYTYNKREAGRGPLKPQEEWVIRENNHPAVIDLDQFNRCNALIAQHRNRSGPIKSKFVHVFSNVLRCASCGSKVRSFKGARGTNSKKFSSYLCEQRIISANTDCGNVGVITEYYIGTFVFTFCANYLKAYYGFSSIASVNKLKKQLLSGMENYHVDINETSLANIYLSLSQSSKSSKKVYYEIDGKSNADSYAVSLLTQERNKCKTAINKLTDLYLIEDGGLSKEEYSKRRKELEGKLQELNAQIKKTEEEGGKTDRDKSADNLAIALSAPNLLNSKDKLDFEELYDNSGAEALKDFVNAIIKEIRYEASRITSITFMNDMVCEFDYQYQSSIKCAFCQKTVFQTVTCPTRTLIIDGFRERRVKMGDEFDPYEKKRKEVCEGCGVVRGKWHHIGCEKEVCPICHKPLMSCGHMDRKIYRAGWENTINSPDFAED